MTPDPRLSESLALMCVVLRESRAVLDRAAGFIIVSQDNPEYG